MKQLLRVHLLTIVFLALALLITTITGIQYWKFRHDVVPFVEGPGVTEMQKLSDYYAPIKGSVGDADIYVLGSGDPSEPSFLVLGGTHPNEPASQMAAVLLMENIEVNFGTVYIILEANRSAFTHSHPQEATPEYYSIPTAFGERTFKYGSRATNAIDQWPIPDIYIHQATGQILSGTDTRNLNRSYPGRTDGTYTEKITYAIAELIRQNDILMTLDLHEASPEYPVNNAIVSHERGRNMLIASSFGLIMDMYSLLEDTRFRPIKIEPSPQNLRGLTHRELGDYTKTIPFLSETSNASQGRIRGKTTESLIVDGYDKFYAQASRLGILEVDHSEAVPLKERAARHVQTFIGLIEAFNQNVTRGAGFADPYYNRGSFDINYNGLEFTSIMDNGIGHFLLDPNQS